jgi:cyclohexyl-isocyanide hydratase
MRLSKIAISSVFLPFTLLFNLTPAPAQDSASIKGYKATSHWVARDVLRQFGAIPTEGRIVTDRNRITGGGVTAGLDFCLTIVAKLRNQTYAEAVQLYLEYDPQPPFNSGSPKTASPAAKRFNTDMFEPFAKTARATAIRA